MAARNPAIDDFVEKAIEYEGADCLTWPFTISGGNRRYGGYATNRRYGGRISRYICKTVYGAPPKPTYEAAHSCNNKLCINQKHLRWATHKENMNDERRPHMKDLFAQ
jgi:hypothetical protein